MNELKITALEKIEKAKQMVKDLCSGKERWHMSIPARENDDPDLVIFDALHAAELALADVPEPPKSQLVPETDKVHALAMYQHCYNLAIRHDVKCIPLGKGLILGYPIIHSDGENQTPTLVFFGLNTPQDRTAPSKIPIEAIEYPIFGINFKDRLAVNAFKYWAEDIEHMFDLIEKQI